MSIGDYIVYAVAVFFIGLGAILIAGNIHRHFRAYVFGVLGVGSIIAGLFAIGVVAVGVIVAVQYFQEHATLQKCMTAHERRAQAVAAPDDYFGRQLRETAAAEAKTCAELAAKKEAEAAKARAEEKSK